MSKRHPIRYQLPCCRQDVQVTGRRSKQMERARQHRCKQCGQVYYIAARNNPIINAVKG